MLRARPTGTLEFPSSRASFTAPEMTWAWTDRAAPKSRPFRYLSSRPRCAPVRPRRRFAHSDIACVEALATPRLGQAAAGFGRLRPELPPELWLDSLADVA